jgi:hypothetical protein
LKDEDGYRLYVEKLVDGRYGYWGEVYDEKEEEFIDKFIILTDAEIAKYTKNTSSTTTYTDNGDGTYSKSYTSSEQTTPVQPTKYKNHTVTTKSYTYKKKNVKTETVGTVTTEEKSGKEALSGNDYVETTITTKNPYVTTFKYKKGRVVKATTSYPETYTMVKTRKTTLPNGTVRETKVEYANGKITQTVYENGAVVSGPVEIGKYDEAKPTASSSTYKYDKKGNLKSGKSTDYNQNYSEVPQMDDKFDDTYVYFIKAQNEPGDVVKVPTSDIWTWSDTFKTTLKKGTKRLLTRLGMTKEFTNGYPDGKKGEYSMNRTTFKLKSKKVASKAKKNVEAQQWMIQNDVFQVVGLR